MTEQQELFFVVANIEDDEILGYVAANGDEVFVNDIESQGIQVFRTPEVAEELARALSEQGEYKVIQVHRDFLDVAAVPDEIVLCDTCECVPCRCGG
jgi:hypothetical protein